MGYSDLENKMGLYFRKNASGEYASEGKKIRQFRALCNNAKPKLDDILAKLIIAEDGDIEKSGDVRERNARMEAYLKSKRAYANDFPVDDADVSTKAKFEEVLATPDVDRQTKIDWVKKHLTLPEMIAALAEVQALESLAGKADPYADAIEKAKKQNDYKQKAREEAEQLKNDYAAFVQSIRDEISNVEARISENKKLALDAAQPKNKSGLTDNAKQLSQEFWNKVTADEEELKKLKTLLEKADAASKLLSDKIDAIKRETQLFEKSEDKKEDKSNTSTSTPSIKSPYASLSDRGKQAADSEFAKDLYQSFAAANSHNKFLMITGPDAHNLLEIARNLSKVGDRQDLQEYCTELLKSEYIDYTTGSPLDGFNITIPGTPDTTLIFESLKQDELIKGLDGEKLGKIKKLFEKLYTINKTKLTVEDLDKLQAYAQALLISTTLQEARWGLGKQITKGIFKLSGRKKSPNFDLGNDVASFLRPFSERKDQYFNTYNQKVDKGISFEDNEQYGPSTAVRSGYRGLSPRFPDRSDR